MNKITHWRIWGPDLEEKVLSLIILYIYPFLFLCSFFVFPFTFWIMTEGGSRRKKFLKKAFLPSSPAIGVEDRGLFFFILLTLLGRKLCRSGLPHPHRHRHGTPWVWISGHGFGDSFVSLWIQGYRQTSCQKSYYKKTVSVDIINIIVPGASLFFFLKDRMDGWMDG